MKNSDLKEERIKQFIHKNHNLVREYYDCYYKRYKDVDFKEQLRILFVNALSAGGEGKISDKASSIRLFESKIKEMHKPTYHELLRVFNVRSYQELFESFKKFKQMGPKKSALFLRDIFYFENIILECPVDFKKKFFVPVDRVILRTMNSIFPRSYALPKAFDEINKLSKTIFPDEPILMEDFWFWGRFYRCKEEKENNKIPYCKFNEDLLYVDKDVTKEYRKKMIEFAKSHVNCPFKEICNKQNGERT